MKQYSPAFERNKDPILQLLHKICTEHKKVLEIGSGPGQHGLYFAQNLEGVLWQPSDLGQNIPSIRAWATEAAEPKLRHAVELDLLSEDWPICVPTDFRPDIVFSMNVAHIVRYEGVRNLVKGAARVLQPGGYLFFYGPWQFRHVPLEPSNQRFNDGFLASFPGGGIREFEALCELAGEEGFSLKELTRMPANNCAFYFEKGVS